jgi:hypothetical protein
MQVHEGLGQLSANIEFSPFLGGFKIPFYQRGYLSGEKTS